MSAQRPSDKTLDIYSINFLAILPVFVSFALLLNSFLVFSYFGQSHSQHHCRRLMIVYPLSTWATSELLLFSFVYKIDMALYYIHRTFIAIYKSFKFLRVDLLKQQIITRYI